MDMIKQELDRIKDRISDPSFLANKGLSNEVGIHVFCYDPKDEIVVQDYIRRLKAEANTPYRIIECDLYEIFLSLLEDKRVLRSVPGLEDKRGKDYLLSQLQKIATPEALAGKNGLLPSCEGAGRFVHDRHWKNPPLHAFSQDARQYAAFLRGHSDCNVLSG